MSEQFPNLRRRLAISFSGGETSAFMTHWLWERRTLWEEVVITFMNTGQENEETLDFVQQCSDHFGWPVVWLEAVINPQRRKGTRHSVVNYETASRDGKPFEAAISKYGLPCKVFPHCTRELKERPHISYIKSLGWRRDEFNTAIGIRSDEADRVSERGVEEGFIYPLVETKRWPSVKMTKPDVNKFWAEQPFRLQLKGYQGNCKWCWKKSIRKLTTIMDENPAAFDFPRRMETLYSNTGAGTLPRQIFRERRTVDDIVQLVKAGYNPSEDDSLDMPGGCGDSCEIFTDAQLSLFDDIP